MYDLLTQVLLWVLIGYIAWFVLKQFIPQKIYTFLGFALLVTLIVLAFFEPSQDVVSEAWSILSLPFRPLGFILLCLLMAFPFDSVTNGKFFRLPVFWALAILLVTSAPTTAYWLHEQAEENAVALARDLTPSGPAPIVLLGQETTLPPLPPRTQLELTERGDRIRRAAQLYNDRAGNAIIVATDRYSGVDDAPQAAREESTQIQSILVDLGVPPGAIRIADNGSTIRESARNVEEVLEETGVGRDILLVTSALETQRAVETFSNALRNLNDGEGVRVIPRPTDFISAQDRRLSFPEDIVPDEQALYLTSRAIQEQFLSIYYFLRGWLSPT